MWDTCKVEDIKSKLIYFLYFWANYGLCFLRTRFVCIYLRKINIFTWNVAPSVFHRVLRYSLTILKDFQTENLMNKDHKIAAAQTFSKTFGKLCDSF